MTTQNCREHGSGTVGVIGLSPSAVTTSAFAKLVSEPSPVAAAILQAFLSSALRLAKPGVAASLDSINARSFASRACVACWNRCRQDRGMSRAPTGG